MTVAARTLSTADILGAIRPYWGFDTLRPLQQEAITAAVEQRDSLVVLPTGGGKSMCYQAPPLLADRCDVVVSPLVALMKDQVDALTACGYPAVALHSGLSPAELRDAEMRARTGQCRLIFAAPERLLGGAFLRMLHQVGVRSFAIDEAHCISHWGHDFRPEYRRLVELRERFPDASLHAYTATATQRVQEDIVEQLSLRDPRVLVGAFDRPNLVFRVVPRENGRAQALEVINRHPQQAGIVYCVSRRETEEVADFLRAAGIKAAHYHAGMTPPERRATQDRFSQEQIDTIVATVAFGMGIDRGDVRYVIHLAMPKSVEHYQQECGRAGRDGLEAECVLFYSPGDVMRWLKLTEGDTETPPEILATAREMLEHMRRVASSYECRHKTLSEYFGQPYAAENCGACDVCLGEIGGVTDGTVTAQKILSCVARVQERFGISHVAEVLRGVRSDRVLRCGHETLSTFGLLRDVAERELTRLIYQLIDQGLLDRTTDEFPTLRLNRASWQVMRGQRPVRIVAGHGTTSTKARPALESWEHVDRGLFEDLRALRREIATERGVPPFVVFGDATLRQLAARRPSSRAALRSVHGVGEKKLEDLGDVFLERIRSYCEANGVSQDVKIPAKSESPAARPRALPPSTAAKRAAYDLFRRGMPVEDVATAVQRALSTVQDYLIDFIREERPDSIAAWVPVTAQKRIEAALAEVEGSGLRPVFEKLGGEISYDWLKIVRTAISLRDRK